LAKVQTRQTELQVLLHEHPPWFFTQVTNHYRTRASTLPGSQANQKATAFAGKEKLQITPKQANSSARGKSAKPIKNLKHNIHIKKTSIPKDFQHALTKVAE